MNSSRTSSSDITNGLLILPNRVNNYLIFVLWWVAIFLLTLISFIPFQTIDSPIWIPIQSCIRPFRICLNPHLDSTSIYRIQAPTKLLIMITNYFFLIYRLFQKVSSITSTYNTNKKIGITKKRMNILSSKTKFP